MLNLFGVAMLWTFMSPPNSHVKTLPPKVMVLGGGALGRWMRQEGGGLMNGLRALIKGIPESSLAPPPCEDTANSAEEGPHQTPNLPVTWSWTCSPLTVGDKFLLCKPRSTSFVAAAQTNWQGYFEIHCMSSYGKQYFLSKVMEYFSIQHARNGRS